MVSEIYILQSNSNSLANQFGIHLILAKQEKLALNSLENQLGKNRNLTKLTSHAHICAHGSWLPSVFPCKWEGEKGNKELRRIPDVSFQEVEGHKHNFVSLRIPDVS
jgi:hypothetical protein